MTHIVEQLVANLSDPEAHMWLVPGGVFALVVAAVWISYRRATRKPSTLERRLGAIHPAGDAEVASDQGVFGALTPALAAQIPESRRETRDFSKMLRSAGLYQPHAAVTIYALRFVLLAIPLIIAGFVAVAAPSDETFRIMLIGGVAGVVLSIVPRIYVFLRRRKRQRDIRNGLADSMDMMSMCIGGGMGISQSLEHVAGQLVSYPALAQELLIIRRQAEVGSLKQALTDFSDRVDLTEARLLTNLLARGDKLGTKLSGTLMEQADHMRQTRRTLATARANKTPVKLVLPIVFCFAPAALLMLLSPAVLELKDFLDPPAGQASVLGNNESLGPQSIFSTLDQLDQDMAVQPAS
ncbi:MAG: type II secretion system F family protein [Pirellulales bacterium]|nr:type II secretion system F family protein [Pirellulales bacterium]